MKKLFVIRHAKATQVPINDFDRSLIERGISDAKKIGDYFINIGINFDLIISSPAKRAFSTAEIIAKKIGFDKNKIQKVQQFYNFDDDGGIFLSELLTLDNNIKTVAVFGHNNTILNFALIASEGKIDEFPTCSVLCLEFDTDDWNQIFNIKPKYIFFISPKTI
jgi:phosphohistidine phosphatase